MGGGKKKKGGGGFDIKRTEVLQAVVLADSFQTKLRPVTFGTPKVLLPLVNVPMINYTLEFLVTGGVQEIFVFCCAHAEEIEAYIMASKWPQQVRVLSFFFYVPRANRPLACSL
jgi:translation initiation factor eIF-2B subunit epsilon